jgi:hemoglobin/transferrin/lactoferrin receptor protein
MKNIQRILITLLVINPLFSLWAQSPISVFIKDAWSKAPLDAVAVYQNNALVGYSNAQGKIKINLSDNSPLLMVASGYDSLSIQVPTENRQVEVLLEPKFKQLEQTVIAANRGEESLRKVNPQVVSIPFKEIRQFNPQTSADLLQLSGQAFVQKSQQGGGSPVLRGFEANRVLLVIDGVRLNNAIYRAGHLQNVITIDPNLLERAEIVMGPSSVMYGSDALGGVINFKTRDPLLAEKNQKLRISGNSFTRYSSANQEKTLHTSLSIGGQKWGSLSSITFSDFDDLMSGNQRNPAYGDWGKRTFYVERINNVDSSVKASNVNLQKGSGYQQLDILQKFIWNPKANIQHGLNLQLSTSSDVPRYDRLTQTASALPRFAEWYYGPQKRQLASYHYKNNRSTFAWDKLIFRVSAQGIEESRVSRRYRRNSLESQIEKVNVFSTNLDLSKQIGKHDFRYGFEGTYQKVNSTASARDIQVDTTFNIATRYPDGGSIYRTLAGYFSHSWEINNHWIFNQGIRISDVWLESKFDDKTYFPFLFNRVAQHNTAPNASIGIIYFPSEDWKISLSGSSGFRAPNVDDIGKVFESTPGQVIIPNPSLRPEYAWNGELGITRFWNQNTKVELVGWYTLLQNAITTGKTQLAGQDSIIFQGVKSRVTSQTNTQEAYLAGGSASIESQVTKHFKISSSLNYTYGRIKTDTVDYPLDHIPPVYGKTSFRLQHGKFKGEFFMLYSGAKRIKDYNLIGEDNFPNATPFGMPAWCTFNLRTSYQINNLVWVQVGLDNLLDTHYRQFSSNISAPGRNLQLTLRADF